MPSFASYGLSSLLSLDNKSAKSRPIMSVMTMTLHQAQLHSRPSTFPHHHHHHQQISCNSRGTKRSRDEYNHSGNDAAITRTQKRIMETTQRERETIHELTLLRLLEAQHKSPCQPLPTRHRQLVPQDSIVCIDCGTKASQASAEARYVICQGCTNSVCKNCSIWVYMDSGDYEACFSCSQL